MSRRLTILAIDPGTRTMGLAFLEGEMLVYHGVKTIPKERTPSATLARSREIVRRLIRDFRPELLALEKTFVGRHRNTALLNVLADEIRAIGLRQGLRVMALAPTTIRKTVCGNGHATKREVARLIVGRYPELKVFLTQDRRWKERYHSNMFDAVALALCARRVLTDRLPTPIAS